MVVFVVIVVVVVVVVVFVVVALVVAEIAAAAVVAAVVVAAAVVAAGAAGAAGAGAASAHRSSIRRRHRRQSNLCYPYPRARAALSTALHATKADCCLHPRRRDAAPTGAVEQVRGSQSTATAQPLRKDTL